MMPSVQRSIHQGHEGFSGTIYSRQRINPADNVLNRALYFGRRASRFCVLAHDHNAVRWENHENWPHLHGLVPSAALLARFRLARYGSNNLL